MVLLTSLPYVLGKTCCKKTNGKKQIKQINIAVLKKYQLLKSAATCTSFDKH